HGVEQYFLERPVAINRPHHLGGMLGRWRRCRTHALCTRRFDISRDDAAPRSGATHTFERNTGFGSEPARERRDDRAAWKPLGAIIARGGSHFEKWIELDRRRCRCCGRNNT